LLLRHRTESAAVFLRRGLLPGQSSDDRAIGERYGAGTKRFDCDIVPQFARMSLTGAPTVATEIKGQSL